MWKIILSAIIVFSFWAYLNPKFTSKLSSNVLNLINQEKSIKALNYAKTVKNQPITESN